MILNKMSYVDPTKNLDCSNEKKCSNRANVTESNFSILNIYLWIHGFGFTQKFCCSWKNILIFAISFIFAAVCNVCSLQEVVVIYRIDRQLSRRVLLYLLKNMAEIMQRVFLYRERQKLIALVKRISALNASFNPVKTFNFKIKLTAFLFIHDVLLILTILINFYFIRKKYPRLDTKSKARGMFFIVRWSFALPPMTTYFCSICFLLKRTLNAFKTKMRIDLNKDPEKIIQIYTVIMSIISEVNHVFHNMIVSGLVSFLSHSFLNILTALTSSEQLSILSLLSVNIFLLYNICYITAISILSSSVSNDVSKIKDAFYEASSHLSRTTFIRIFFKISEKFEGFILFDSIPIDKSFVLMILSLLTTYSVMFATFSVSY